MLSEAYPCVTELRGARAYSTPSFNFSDAFLACRAPLITLERLVQTFASREFLRINFRRNVIPAAG